MVATRLSGEALIAAARGLAPLISGQAAEAERGGRLTDFVVDALRTAGLWRLKAPAAVGGHEADAVTILRVVEEVSRADGATGWNLMIGTDGGYFAGRMTAQQAAALYARWPDGIMAGTLNPRGARALAVPGGYRITGRWSFGSGIHHADWVLVAASVCDGETPRTGPHGAPVLIMATLPSDDLEILDTWHVSGLRGTGSTDHTARDVFVPEERTTDFQTAAPGFPGPLYALPVLGFLSANAAAVPLGIARHAIEALMELAAAKTPTGQTVLLRERAAVQADVARAEALVRSARAFLHGMMDEVWQTVACGAQASPAQSALLRTAAIFAAQSAAQAVDLMYNAGGATAIYESNPLERCFRDVHAATQHLTVQPAALEGAGKVLLGPDSGQ